MPTYTPWLWADTAGSADVFGEVNAPGAGGSSDLGSLDQMDLDANVDWRAWYQEVQGLQEFESWGNGIGGGGMGLGMGIPDQRWG
jgi:hypothetical protein